jgi:signal transduction histidine kinase
MPSSPLDVLAGVALVLAGLGVWQRRHPATAVLLLASGALWFVGGVFAPLVLAHRGPLTHALVGYPRGRLTRSTERVVVVVGYVAAVAYAVGRSSVVTLLLGGSVVAVTARNLRAARGAERRARAVALAASAAIWGVLGVGAVARLAGRHVDSQVLVAYEITLAAVAAAVFIDVRLRRSGRSAITSLAVDLGQAAPPSVRDLIAAALGDPSLVLGYDDPRTGRLADEAGRPVAIAPQPPGRTVTELHDGGRRIAVLIHDSAVLDDPALVPAVAALTKIALVNSRLQAEVAGRLAEVDASRRRLLSVADTERIRLEAELRAAVQARLDRVAALLAPLPGDAGADLATHLAASQEAISEFARGVHPRVLTDHGLATAVCELASRAPVPVAVTVPDGRFDPDIEAAAYFVCAEGLTNLAKYARATRAAVRVTADAGELAVEVADDGVGGADPAAGSGLTGLADRLDVLGGRLAVESPQGRGTRLTASIPLPGR